MNSTDNPKGRSLQSLFRVGKYAICQIPMNIVVGEIGLDGKGNERITQNTKSYHKNYDYALENLYDRLLRDKMAKSTLDLIKSPYGEYQRG